MAEVETGIEIIEDLIDIEEAVGSRNRGRSTFKNKSAEKRCHYCREPGHFIKSVRKRNGSKVNKGTTK